MIIEYQSKLRPEFFVNGDRGRCWQLVEPFAFAVDGRVFEIPVGFWTDFASVPRALWPLISPYDLGVGPVPHDFGYFSGYESKPYWDRVFQACMEKDGVAPWRRAAAYHAVVLLGGGVWEAYRQSNQHYRVTGAAKKLSIENWPVRDTLGSLMRSTAVKSVEETLWKDRVGKLTTAD